MKLIQSFNRAMTGSGLEAVRAKAPLLARRWAVARGVGGTIEDARALLAEETVDGMAQSREFRDWQDSAAVSMVAMVLLAGLIVPFLHLPDVLAAILKLNPVFVVSAAAVQITGSYIVAFVVAQITLLCLAALAWRLLAAAPFILLALGALTFVGWSGTMFLISPFLRDFVIIPAILIALACLAYKEVKRVAYSPGAGVGGSLVAIFAMLSALAFLFVIGYITNVLIPTALPFLGLSAKSLEFLAIAIVIVVGCVTIPWSNKLLFAWSANEDNSPVLCATVVTWTFLLDMVTFGATALLYDSTYAVRKHDEDRADAKAASEKPVGESGSGQDIVEWSIGQHVDDGHFKK